MERAGALKSSRPRNAHPHTHMGGAMRSSFVAYALAAAGSCVFLACGVAHDPDSVGVSQGALSNLTVKQLEEPSFTSGVATNDPPIAGQPSVCSDLGVKCAAFDLSIELASNVWSK